MVPDVRHDQHFRGLPSATVALPEPLGSAEWRSGCHAHAGTEELRGESERCVLALWDNHPRLMRLAEYVAKYASKEAVDEAGEDTESEDELSSAGSYESGGEEPAGTMDDV